MVSSGHGSACMANHWIGMLKKTKKHALTAAKIARKRVELLS